MVSEKEHRTTTRRTIVTGAMGVKPFADNFSGKFSLLTDVCKLLFQSEFFWQLIVVDNFANNHDIQTVRKFCKL